MLKKTIFIILAVSLLTCNFLLAQKDLSKMRWRTIVQNLEKDWYGSAAAIAIADNVLLYQRNVGGWPKNIQMHRVLTKKEMAALQKLKKKGKETTIDNGATYLELVFLSKVYSETKIEKYKTAFFKGIEYLLEAQYDNGGWPQFYPLKKGYYTHITYNDNAMINVLNVLKEIAAGGGKLIPVENKEMIERAQNAWKKGIQCILKTQYIQNGELSVWCAQHDEKTFQPAKARAYELPSLSGSESAGIVLHLMEIDNPSPKITMAVEAAVRWYEKNKITGLRVERYNDSNGLKEKRVVADETAPALWARFSELKDNRPFFCDRDGIKKYSLAEIGHERRTGYGWYSEIPQMVLDKYPQWIEKIESTK